ncbi:hypothetical protein [Rhodococcus sp. H29-C3]|uniref:thioesterase family protein n=1 Tax=Rhodococcus sp. H29-C3 TaxID=3046307 RepID=UPI0024B9C168|nr:hypothetical protein [Rhodococcus sp. H29-C3]MDJ0362546.1 hypothetical protein [Rhodococcus sp. H29-C3]
MRTVQMRQFVEVRPEDCATQWGNDGLDVLSTPTILGTMERLCVEALAPALRVGEMTVGTGVEMSHTAAALLGELVSYDIEAAVDGRRIDVTFTVTSSDQTVISRGRHSRATVDARRFKQKLGLIPD